MDYLYNNILGDINVKSTGNILKFFGYSGQVYILYELLCRNLYNFDLISNENISNEFYNSMFANKVKQTDDTDIFNIDERKRDEFVAIIKRIYNISLNCENEPTDTDDNIYKIIIDVSNIMTGAAVGSVYRPYIVKNYIIRLKNQDKKIFDKNPEELFFNKIQEIITATPDIDEYSIFILKFESNVEPMLKNKIKKYFVEYIFYYYLLFIIFMKDEINGFINIVDCYNFINIYDNASFLKEKLKVYEESAGKEVKLQFNKLVNSVNLTKNQSKNILFFKIVNFKKMTILIYLMF